MSRTEPLVRPGRRSLLLTVVAATTGLMLALPAAAEGTRSSPLQVVASFSILADLAREIAGPAAQVASLAGPNADPHAWQPAPSDLQRVARADLLLVNGLGFEGWLDRLLANARPRGRVVVSTERVEVRHVGPHPDPHAWQSPAQARHYVDAIEVALLAALALRGADPATMAGVRARAVDLRARLDGLDREIRRAVDAVPPEARRAVTAHGAFGYFGRDYGITFIALHGAVPDAEASAGQLARLIRQVRAQRATALFAESTSDPRLMTQVAAEAGIAIGGTLYADALTPPGGEADTALKLLTHNARTITAALQRAAGVPR
jgi:zinc/manganese transport system substrate-binding protein